MILALLLLLAQSTASPAPAATIPPSGVYRTEIHAQHEAIGYTGILKLRIADGYVNGTYRPDSGGTLTNVTGGSDGTNIWFDLQTLGGIHVNAHYENGKIVGLGSSRYGRLRVWEITATPDTP